MTVFEQMRKQQMIPYLGKQAGMQFKILPNALENVPVNLWDMQPYKVPRRRDAQNVVSASGTAYFMVDVISINPDWVMLQFPSRNVGASSGEKLNRVEFGVFFDDILDVRPS